MHDAADKDVEALARADSRARLGLAQLLRLYLDPFALFKNVSVGPPLSQAQALQYNRRHRHMLLVYLRRWSGIAIVCLMGGMPLAALARAEPLLCVPFLGLELGFAFAVCVLLLAGAVYFLLGVEDLR